MKNSQISGFYKLPPQERLEKVAEFAGLSPEEVGAIMDPGTLSQDMAEHMIENVIGRFSLPMAVATNFLINGKEYIIPMVTEEASVVAAASNAARMARGTGGFTTSYTGSIMIAQIQILDVETPHYACSAIQEAREEIARVCNEKDPVLVANGGGFYDLETRILDTDGKKMVVVHLKINTLDAMGANAVNTMAEAVSPLLETISGGRVNLRILSNLAVHRLAGARAVISKDAVGGEEIVDKMIAAYQFAYYDPFRAATHNKGIMNGIVPVVMATGNDTRAIESGAHAFAARSGQYRSLTVWEKTASGDLAGSIQLPMAVGLVGGATKIHPTARVSLKILDVESAAELAQVIAAVGLAQNLAAIRALAAEGIQKGHMSLHARNLAATAGAKGDLLDKIVAQMVKDKAVRLEYAMELLEKWKETT